MATFQAKDANASTQYFNADGAGTAGNPFTPVNRLDGGWVSVSGSLQVQNGLQVSASGTVYVTNNFIPVSGSVNVLGTPNVTVANASIPVTDNGGSLTVDGYVAVTGSVGIIGTPNVTVANASIPVTDNGSSLTVDGVVGVTGTVSIGNTVNVSDGGSSLTVDGAVGVTGTVSVGNTVTVSDDGAFNVTVDNASIPVTDNGGSLTVDGYVTTSGTVGIQGTVPVSNSNIDALAFGIGAPASALSVVQATGTSVSVTIDADNAGIGGGIQYVDDNPASGGETGTLILGVRNDAGGTPVSADGDFQPIQFDNSGRLRVVTQGGAGGTSAVDESSFTLASDSGTPAMGYVGEDTLATGTVGVLGMTASRQLRVVIDQDNAGIGGGTQYTEDDASVANPVGNQLVTRRRDTLSAETSADGDVIALNSTNKGELYVKHADGVGVTGTVTVVDGGGSITVDGFVFASGTVGIEGTPDVNINNSYIPVSGTVGIEGSVSVGNTVTVSDDGAFNVTVDNASIPVTDNGGSLTVDGYVTASGTVGIEGTVSANITNGYIPVSGTVGIEGIPDVNITNSYIPVSGSVILVEDTPPGRYDTFGYNVVSTPNNDIDVQFFRADPESLVNITTANGSFASGSSGGALFSSSTNTNGSIQAVTNSKTVYRSGGEVYAMFTAAFSAGVSSSYMRIGLYDSSNGLFIGYEGTSFGVTYRKNGSDISVSKGSFSRDTLIGAAGSKFTRNGTPEAVDLSKLNIYRIRFGWLGSAPVSWEIMAPDGNWVVFHETLFPNLQATPSIETADLPITLDITKTTAGATNLTIQTNCWGAGSNLSEKTGIVDLPNSRPSSTLSNGTSWNSSGGWTDIHRYALSTILLYSSTASAQGTLTVQFSMDGTNVHRTISYDVTDANNHPPHTLLPVAQYMRVSYTADGGGANNHAGFMVQTIHHVTKSAKLTSRVTSSINNTTDVDNTRSVIVGQTGGGSYVNVGATNGGGLKISVNELNENAIDLGNGTVGAGTQRVTIASDTTGVLSVDDNGGSLTVDGYVMVSGTVGIQGTVPVSNTNIDNLSFGIQDASAGLSVVHATGTSVSVVIDGDSVGIGGGVQYVEDNPSAGGETGTLLLGVRNDAGGTPVSTDGDFQAIQFDNSGRLRVVTQGGAGGTSSVDEAAFTLASDSGTPAMGYVGEDSLATGTVGVLGMTADRQLRVVIDADNAGIGGGTQYTEDDASVVNPVGNQLMARRRDTLSGETTTDGDVVALNSTDRGELYIKHADGVGVTGTVTVTDGGGSITVDGFVFASGTVGIEGTPNVNITNSYLPVSGTVGIENNVTVVPGAGFGVTGTITVGNASIPVTDNGGSLTVDFPNGYIGVSGTVDIGNSVTVVPGAGFGVTGTVSVGNTVTVSDDGAFNVTVDNASIPVTDNGGSITVDFPVGYVGVSGTVNIGNTVNVLPAGGFGVTGTITVGNASIPVTDNGGSLTVDFPNGYVQVSGTVRVLPSAGFGVTGTVSVLPSAGFGVTGTVSIGNTVNVADGGGSLTVDFPNGYVQISGTAAVTQATASNLNAQVVGNIAHDGVDSGNPVSVGLRTIAHGTNPTAVAAADRSVWYANRAGIPFVMAGHPNIVTLRANYTSAQSDTAIVTVAGGTKIVVTRVSVTVDNNVSVDVAARIGFGAASTPTTTGVVLSHPGIASGSGVVEGTGSGILGIGADGEDLRITSEVPTGGSIDVVVSYYTIES